MRQTSIDDLVRFSMELLGLTLTMGAIMVIAAFYAFDGFGLPATRSTLLFCLFALFGCAAAAAGLCRRAHRGPSPAERATCTMRRRATG